MKTMLWATALVELTTAIILALTGGGTYAVLWALLGLTTVGWALAEASSRGWKVSAERWREIAGSQVVAEARKGQQ